MTVIETPMYQLISKEGPQYQLIVIQTIYAISADCYSDTNVSADSIKHHNIQTRSTLMQASKNSQKPYLFPQKKFISVYMFYAINILNTIYYFKLTNLN